MQQFLVRWTIAVTSEDAESAARQALSILSRPDRRPTLFTVIAPNGEDVLVDLHALNTLHARDGTAEARGRQAAVGRRPKNLNPYPVKTPAALKWQEGWTQAKPATPKLPRNG